MTTGQGSYGTGFIDLEPRLERDALARINGQLDRTFKGLKLDIDQGPLNAVRSNLETVDRLAGEATSEFREMARGAGTVDDRIRNLAGHLDISEDEARRMANEFVTANRNANLLEDSAIKTARALGLSETEAKKFASAMNRAADSGAAVGRLQGGLANLRSSFSLMAASAVTFFGVRGLIGFAQGARDAFVKLGESANAVNVIFGEGASTIFEFSEGVAQSAGLAKSEFQQMSTVLGAALQNAGFEADVAAEKTVTLTQRAADMASVFNTDVSEALGAIQAALRGESDPIERFGVGLSAARVDAEAAALGFKKVAGEFDSTAKTAARLSLIMAQTDAVANDFANTSDSLANAQRINAAEMENVRAEIGEELLPVFEALVEATPTLVEGLRDMVPNITALTLQLAEMAKSTPGVLDLVDVLGVLTSLPRGLGILFDLSPVKLFADALSGDFAGAFNRTIERMNTEGLIEDLRAGEDAALVLANRLADVGRRGKLDKDFIRSLREIAGTDLRDSALSIQTVLEASEQLGLKTDEVAALRDVYIELIAAMDAQTRASEGERFGQTADTIKREAVPALRDFQQAADDAGLSLEELAFSTDPAAVAFRELLTPSEDLALSLEAIASSSDVAAGVLATNLRPAIADVGGALEDLNEDGKTTPAEFIRNLQDMTAATLEFKADIASIAVISPGLAAHLRSLPEDMREEILKGFRDDPTKIIKAEAALFGTPEQLAGTVRDIVGSAMELLRKKPDQEAIENFAAVVLPELPEGSAQALTQVLQGVLDVSFADLAPVDATPVVVGSFEGLNHAQITAAMDDALAISFDDVTPGDLTDQIATSLRGMDSAELAAAVEASIGGGLDEVDFFDEGREMRATLMDGLSTQSSGETGRLRQSILSTLNNATQKQSPPKLFTDAGTEAGEAFWGQSGFAGVPLDFPTVDFRRQMGTARLDVTELDGGAGVGGAAIGEVNFYDTREKPAEESLQEAGVAVAVMLNLRK